MKTLAIIIALAGAPGLALGLDGTSPTAKAAALPTANPTPAAPVPTPKPLYVDYSPPDWAKAKEHITLEQAKKMSKDKGVLFCDARAKVEYDGGHIPGAIPLPTGEFDKYYNQHLARIKKAKKLVTYCHGIGCRLSEKSANSLVDKGFKNVAVFFGGWPQWSEHQLPVEKGDTFASDVALSPTPAPTAAATAVSPAPTSPAAAVAPVPTTPAAANSAPAPISPAAK